MYGVITFLESLLPKPTAPPSRTPLGHIALPTINPVPPVLTFPEAARLARRQFRPLLVFLHSPEHPDSSSFLHIVLTDPNVVDLISTRFVFFGVDIEHLAGYRMATSLSATRYPTLAVLVAVPRGRSAEVTVVQRLDGPIIAQTLVNVLTQAADSQTPHFSSMRLDQEAQEHSRILRQQQDDALAASIAADQHRDQMHSQVEDQESHRRTAVASARSEAQSMVIPEPDEQDGLVKLAIRCPAGTRIERRFRLTDRLSSVFVFVLASGAVDLLPGEFALALAVPRRVFLSSNEMTLEEAGLAPRSTLLVELLL